MLRSVHPGILLRPPSVNVKLHFGTQPANTVQKKLDCLKDDDASNVFTPLNDGSHAAFTSCSREGNDKKETYKHEQM